MSKLWCNACMIILVWWSSPSLNCQSLMQSHSSFPGIICARGDFSLQCWVHSHMLSLHKIMPTLMACHFKVLRVHQLHCWAQDKQPGHHLCNWSGQLNEHHCPFASTQIKEQDNSIITREIFIYFFSQYS